MNIYVVLRTIVTSPQIPPGTIVDSVTSDPEHAKNVVQELYSAYSANSDSKVSRSRHDCFVAEEGGATVYVETHLHRGKIEIF